LLTPYSMISKTLETFLRAYLARKLRDKGYSQPRIADFLGVSQPTIHAYLNSEIYSIENILSKIKEMGISDKEFTLVAEEIMNLLLEEDRVGAMRIFIIYINNLLLSLKLCNYHRKIDPRIPENCNICAEVFMIREDTEMIEALERAFQLIASVKGLVNLVPEVGMNIAYRKKETKDLKDILAFPGRIFKINNQIVKIGKPEWGASRHLGSILLKISSSRPELRAVVNLKKHECISEWIKKNKIPHKITGPHETGLEKEVIDSVARAVSLDKNIRLVIDEGGMWLEPNIYIFSEDPLSLSLIIREIASFCLEETF